MCTLGGGHASGESFTGQPVKVEPSPFTAVYHYLLWALYIRVRVVVMLMMAAFALHLVLKCVEVLL